MKLFAKHLKVEEQETMLSSTKAAIAVGTPNRLLKLAERGSLKLGRLRYIILDVQLDSKKRWDGGTKGVLLWWQRGALVPICLQTMPFVWVWCACRPHRPLF